MTRFNLLVVATVALLQVHHAHSFYSIFQSNPSPPQAEGEEQPQEPFNAPAYSPHHHNRHHGGQGAGVGFIAKAHGMVKNLHNLNCGFNNGMFNQFGQGAQHHLLLPQQPLAIKIHHGRKEFYNECGTTTRHCEWTQRQQQPLKNKLAKAHHAHVAAETPAKAELDYTCFTVKHVCVGNTENCISNRTCDVAMKIAETSIVSNGKPISTGVVSVSYINNCHMEGQSVTDVSRMPQMLFAIGFATHDEAGNTLECRHPKASDFKLVFLWKNSTVEEGDNLNGHCRPKPEHHIAVQYADPDMYRSIQTWPAICKTVENKDEKFTLKSFLATHSPISKYTSFFNPPFTFADNYELQYSSNKMVISGVVSD